jgi:hypothetical protein
MRSHTHTRRIAVLFPEFAIWWRLVIDFAASILKKRHELLFAAYYRGAPAWDK